MKRGPFTSKDVVQALKADGWTPRPGGNHQVWEHPTKPGKYTVSAKWTGLKISDPILKGMSRTCTIPKDQLLRLLNGKKG
jgi:predicted RNA binding protein YcfA (HicA-like mRNA interferase family)